jgi:hypothetical protein
MVRTQWHGSELVKSSAEFFLQYQDIETKMRYCDAGIQLGILERAILQERCQGGQLVR